MPYETTGVSSRDHVRKTLWEIFSGDPDESEFTIANNELVANLENELFKSTGSDAKTKAYRDKTKNLQLKLKGTRYVE